MKFTVFWLDGTKDVLEGESFSDAFNKAGYGRGANSSYRFL